MIDKIHRDSKKPIIFSFLFVAIVALLFGLFAGCNEPTQYPKLALVNQNIERLKPNYELSLREAAKYQMIVGDSRPEVIEKVRNRGGNFVSLYTTMPTNVWPPTSWQSWMEADTLWSIERLKQFYVMKNKELGAEWLYRNTNGSYIERWNKLECNWSLRCDLGVYGTSDGLTYNEWLSTVAIPQIANSSKFKDAYHGFNFDVLEGCSNWDLAFSNVDINNDGIDDCLYSNCSSDRDMFKIATERGTELFLRNVIANIPPECLIIVGQDRVLTASKNKINGRKFENWMRQSGSNKEWLSWWDGHGDGYANTPGYCSAELLLSRYGSSTAYDKVQGWDMSVIQTAVPKSSANSLEDKRRFARYALGTALLGDGYYCLQYDDYSYFRIPEMDTWRFKIPALSEAIIDYDQCIAKRMFETLDGKIVTLYVSWSSEDAWVVFSPQSQ